MKPTQYEVFAEQRTDPESGGKYTAYGIKAYRQDFRGKVPEGAIHDITTNREAIVELVAKCNKGQLDPAHLRDVVDDFLAE